MPIASVVDLNVRVRSEQSQSQRVKLGGVLRIQGHILEMDVSDARRKDVVDSGRKEHPELRKARSETVTNHDKVIEIIGIMVLGKAVKKDSGKEHII